MRLLCQLYFQSLFQPFPYTNLHLTMHGEWNPEDTEFFYPDMPSSWGIDEIVSHDCASYYWTVHTFVRRLRFTQSEDTIEKANAHTFCNSARLSSCSKGKVRTWWLNQNPIIQTSLTHCGHIEQWCQLLLRDFKHRQMEPLLLSTLSDRLGCLESPISLCIHTSFLGICRRAI
jgi:hypothetical protein